MTEPTNMSAPGPTAPDPPVAPAAARTPGAARTPANWRLTSAVAGIAALIWAADQGSKLLAVHQLTGRGRVDVLGSLFGFVLIRNSGAAFSMATGQTWLLTLVALAVVVTIVRFAPRLGSWGWAVALGLLLGGATGNLTDRLFRAPGFFRGNVVDFLEFPHWPVFNLADSCIVTAAALIALLSLRGIGIDGQRVAATGGTAVANDD